MKLAERKRKGTNEKERTKETRRNKKVSNRKIEEI